MGADSLEARELPDRDAARRGAAAGVSRELDSGSHLLWANWADAEAGGGSSWQGRRVWSALEEKITLGRDGRTVIRPLTETLTKAQDMIT